MTFLLVAAGSFLGTLLGNLSLFYIIGLVAQRKEKKQLEELQKMQQGYLEMVQRESARMKKYAEMEG
jgi:membrane protein DedA with SNARE-associated domain